MSYLELFCRQVRQRSQENRKAVSLLQHAGAYGIVVGVLRQELDSMLRVIYLLSVRDRARQKILLKASITGEMWRHPNGRRVTDREMKKLAQKLHGWTGSVYRFGCAFIHLSRLHDYMARDPMRCLSSSERRDLLTHLRAYHGGPRNDRPAFSDVVPYFPQVFDKIASNLDCYLRSLERDEDLTNH